MNKDIDIIPIIKSGDVPFDLILNDSNNNNDDDNNNVNIINDNNVIVIEFINNIQKYIDAILVIFFILWFVLFCEFMDRSSLIELFYLPAIGIFAAFLANAIPIGGGIVYIPVLSLLSSNMKMDVTFTICTMTIGNGLFGFLKWIQKNPNIFIYDSFLYTVLPSSIGSIISILYLPKFPIWFIRKFFAVFCIILGLFVTMAAYRGGVDKVIILKNNNIVKFDLKNRPIQIFSFISFLGGLLLVPNIGVGPAMITFLGLCMLGYEPKQSIITGIITGGWVCIVPALLHLFILNDVPVKLWLMVLPGVYIGASFAPMVHDYFGIIKVLGAFGVFLLLTSLLFLLH